MSDKETDLQAVKCVLELIWTKDVDKGRKQADAAGVVDHDTKFAVCLNIQKYYRAVFANDGPRVIPTSSSPRF
jgi:hypothetical protein